jgi:hypothetical protein
MKKFVRRKDLILLTELVRRLQVEIGGELRESVDIVCECLKDMTPNQSQFWMLSSTGGLPEPADEHPQELLINFFNAHWWDDESVRSNERWKEEFGRGRLEFELCERLALLHPDAKTLQEQVVKYLKAPINLGEASEGYLDPSHPRFAPKLAAAVRAWQSVTNAGNRSPKQAIEKWLRANAAELGLTNPDGIPVNQAIEECSAVANWQPKGGAVKTPGN